MNKEYIYFPEALERLDEIEYFEVMNIGEYSYLSQGVENSDMYWFKNNQTGMAVYYFKSDLEYISGVKKQPKTPLLTQGIINEIYKRLHNMYGTSLQTTENRELYNFYLGQLDFKRNVFSFTVEESAFFNGYEKDDDGKEINYKKLYENAWDANELLKSYLKNFKIEENRLTDGYSRISGMVPTELIEEIKGE